ncbi:Sigma factor AlgU negative regulatory protein [compost metagenome]
MSREALQESLSAVMDNEADELELRRVLAASEDQELRATWSRYQIARAVMHKELLEPRLDIAAAVSAALAEEAVPAKVVRGPWRTLGRLAVAASVTLAVLAGVRLYNQDDVAGTQQLAQQQATQPAMVMPQAQQGAVLAGYSEEGQQAQQPIGATQASSGWHEKRLPSYLRQHAQQAAMSGSDSALPYARAASLESR